MPEASLAPARAVLVEVSAALAARDGDLLIRTLERAAASAGHDEVEEVILQSYLFLGYPMALNGFAAWRRFSAGRPEATIDDPDGWVERGQDVCRAVYGGQYPRLRENIRDLHPDMERWMVKEGYGKVLGRPGLSLADRELCISALLAVLDVPTQLYSHLRGALNVGVPPEEVEHALTIAADVSTTRACGHARDTWRAVLERLQQPSSEMT